MKQAFFFSFIWTQSMDMKYSAILWCSAWRIIIVRLFIAANKGGKCRMQNGQGCCGRCHSTLSSRLRDANSDTLCILPSPIGKNKHNTTQRNKQKKLWNVLLTVVERVSSLQPLSGKKYICSLGRPSAFSHWLAFSQSPRCLILISILSLRHSPSCSALTASPGRSIPVVPTVAESKN